MENQNFILVPANQFNQLLSMVTELYKARDNASNKKQETILLTTAEAARRLKCSTKTVLNYIELGKLPAVNFNKGSGLRCKWKIDSDDLEKFIKAKRY